MSTNAIFVIAQRGFSAQVEIKIGIRRNEKKSIRANKFVQWKSALTLLVPGGRIPPRWWVYRNNFCLAKYLKLKLRDF